MSIEKEYKEFEARGIWQNEFEHMKEKCDEDARDKRFSLEHSKQNRDYNRYRDVNPYDHSRIVLNRSSSRDTDYINANLVRCERAQRDYILTQGPLPITVSHFWLMVWEQNSKAILMLNKLIEKKQVKCHKYWPEGIGSQYTMNLEDVALRVEYIQCEEFDNFCIRTFLLSDMSSGTPNTKEVFQFHYTTWPDFGTPNSPKEFLQFLKKVRDMGVMSSADVGPPIVHCSAGIGRSGTFCLVDCCLVLVDKFGEDNISAREVLRELRSYRMGLIQTTDQLRFSYKAIIEGIKLFNDTEWCKSPVESMIKTSEVSEDGPPPLPPPRTDSLSMQGGGGVKGSDMSAKPLPLAPTSDDMHDDDDDDNNETEQRTVSNNSRNRDLMQPLPQIPMEEEEEDSDQNSDDDKESMVESYGSSDEEVRNVDLGWPKTATNANPEESAHLVDLDEEEVHSKLNGSSPANSPDNDERNTLRKRVREEKQQAMAEKVKQIKRKQRESEDGVVAAKKRRSLLVKITLAAAVLIGFVCVYAYARN